MLPIVTSGSELRHKPLLSQGGVWGGCKAFSPAKGVCKGPSGLLHFADAPFVIPSCSPQGPLPIVTSVSELRHKPLLSQGGVWGGCKTFSPAKGVCKGPSGLLHSADAPFVIPSCSPQGPLQTPKLLVGSCGAYILHLSLGFQASLSRAINTKKDFDFHRSLTSNFALCGERGIRTLDTLLRCTHFPGALLKPLGHLSISPVVAYYLRRKAGAR